MYEGRAEFASVDVLYKMEEALPSFHSLNTLASRLIAD